MTCEKCGKELQLGEWPFCGGQNAHGFGSQRVVGDECDMVIENMTPEPIHFTSKTAWRAKMKELGLVNRVQHVPVPGSDKSPHTSRWV